MYSGQINAIGKCRHTVQRTQTETPNNMRDSFRGWIKASESYLFVEIFVGLLTANSETGGVFLFAHDFCLSSLFAGMSQTFWQYNVRLGVIMGKINVDIERLAYK